MAELGEYKFAIDAFTPLTISMKRLQQYLADLVNLFGNEEHVHFLRVEEGSAAPAMFVDRNAVNKVEKRLEAVRNLTASASAMDAYVAINDKLAEDNAVAELIAYHGRVLRFPGREQTASPEIGPIIESGTLEGEVFIVGGRDATISVYLRDGDRVYICTTSREKGRQIAADYLFKRVRVYGQGEWKRLKDTRWKLTHFDIVDVTPLKNDSLSDVVANLRSIQNSELDKIDDPLGFLNEIRETGEM